MANRVFISVPLTDQCQHYLRVVKKALFQLEGMPMVDVSSDDVIANGDYLTSAYQMIRESDIFVGIYGTEHGDIVPGSNQSFAEAEYEYARSNGLPVVVFLPQDAQQNADERQQQFIDHLQTHHVINYFQNDDDLAAQIKLKIRDLKESLKFRRGNETLKPPQQGFNGLDNILPPAPKQSADAERTQEAPKVDESAIVEDDTEFKALVERALTLAEDDLEGIFSRVLELHDARRYVDSMQRDTKKDDWLHVSPIFGEPITRSQFRADIFMIMPFRERYTEVYENVIRPVVSDLNLTIKRGDDFSSVSGAIMDEVWAALNACKLVIVETTEINANVYYELGIAHTLGKPAILLTQTDEVEELPFDIRHLRFIRYDDSIEGGNQLEEQLRKSLIWTLNDLEERNDTANGESQSTDKGE